VTTKGARDAAMTAPWLLEGPCTPMQLMTVLTTQEHTYRRRWWIDVWCCTLRCCDTMPFRPTLWCFTGSGAGSRAHPVTSGDRLQTWLDHHTRSLCSCYNSHGRITTKPNVARGTCIRWCARHLRWRPLRRCPHSMWCQSHPHVRLYLQLGRALGQGEVVGEQPRVGQPLDQLL
jgi:hypothetical protein